MSHSIILSTANAREIILIEILIKRGRKVPVFIEDYELGLPVINKVESNDSLTRQSNHS